MPKIHTFSSVLSPVQSSPRDRLQFAKVLKGENFFQIINHNHQWLVASLITGSAYSANEGMTILTSATVSSSYSWSTFTLSSNWVTPKIFF